jgi:UDP-N-acetylmuramoyl-L-alanyl-D-glutamate--2,6-diaminopimelate ligase
MQKAFNFLKKVLGKKGTKWVRPLGHGLKGLFAAAKYKFPAKKLKIIGITGTKGKTTTSTIMGRLANLYGIKTGYITTAVINTGSSKGEFLNPYKMTSIDSMATQKYLAEMVNNGCKWVVLEISSQGLEQNRHWGIFGFDETIFLNIYPEHIEAHGSWENYKSAKGKLFKQLKPNGIFLSNKDIPESKEMWKIIPNNIKKSITYVSVGYDQFQFKRKNNTLFQDIVINNKKFSTNFSAPFDQLNCFFAIQGIASLLTDKRDEKESIIQKLAGCLTYVYGVPGRMEWVIKNGVAVTNKNKNSKARQKNISILVDYAHEPESMRQLLDTLYSWKKDGFYEQIIHIVSCDGAGRDDWKKPVLGSVSLMFADYSILTTDNYEERDNPQDIVDLLGNSLEKKLENKKYFKILRRKDAFVKALEIAAKGNKRTLIVSTGVGSEQGLTQPGGKIEWDERDVWKTVLDSRSI